MMNFCKNCEKEFYIKPSGYARGRGVFCSMKCKSLSQIGKIASTGPLFKKGQIPWNLGKRYPNPKQQRELHSQWKGGITAVHMLLRNSPHSKAWRTSIFQRDDFTCQKCGERGGKLEAHHVKSFSRILNDNKIESFEDGLACAELWDIANGETCCVDCHRIGIHKHKYVRLA